MRINLNINVVSWVMGIAFYYSGIKYLINFDILNFLLMIILAIIVFPPSFDILEKKIEKYFNFKLNNNYRLFFIIILLLAFNYLNAGKINDTDTFNKKQSQIEKNVHEEEIAYRVDRIVDGDTIKVEIDNKIEIVRLIGINTPESVHPNKPLECFGKESSDKLRDLLSRKYVFLKKDDSQENRDKYSRLLRYVYRTDYLFINKWLIENGYAYEFTYKNPYLFQKEFKNAEQKAKENKLGLWADGACDNFITNKNMKKQECLIKGNISFSNQKKIFHLPGCDDYDKTIINEGNGEKWFCSEEEAIKAGWQKAKNCP